MSTRSVQPECPTCGVPMLPTLRATGQARTPLSADPPITFRCPDCEASLAQSATSAGAAPRTE